MHNVHAVVHLNTLDAWAGEALVNSIGPTIEALGELFLNVRYLVGAGFSVITPIRHSGHILVQNPFRDGACIQLASIGPICGQNGLKKGLPFRLAPFLRVRGYW